MPFIPKYEPRPTPEGEPKLTVEMIPRTMWEKNLRNAIPKEQWDALRRECYERAGYVCEICGGQGDEWPVEAHERWSYDNVNKIQKLEGLIALCPLCHSVKHLGRSINLGEGKGNAALKHLQEVNGWSGEQRYEYLVQVLKDQEQRNEIIYTLDLTWIEGKKYDLY